MAPTAAASDELLDVLQRNKDSLSNAEKKVLAAVGQQLPPTVAELLQQQVASVNKVERFADGKEVNLFQIERGKPAFQEHLLFSNRAPERRLATLKILGVSGQPTVRCVLAVAHHKRRPGYWRSRR